MSFLMMMNHMNSFCDYYKNVSASLLLYTGNTICISYWQEAVELSFTGTLRNMYFYGTIYLCYLKGNNCSIDVLLI